MARVASFSANVKTTHTEARHKLGTLKEFPDGSMFRYALNGAVAQVAGRVVQSVVPTSAHVNIAVQAAAAVGDRTVNVTLGATAVVADEYADGYLYVNDAGADTTTEGYTYRIKSHPANAGSSTLAVTLYDDSPVLIALTTNSEVSLIHNKFAKVIIQPSPPTAQPVGVAPVAVAANAYFWCQTKGPCAVLTDGTIAQGKHVMCSDSVDGAVETWNITEGTPNVEISFPVGQVISVNATTEESLIDLRFE